MYLITGNYICYLWVSLTIPEVKQLYWEDPRIVTEAVLVHFMKMFCQPTAPTEQIDENVHHKHFTHHDSYLQINYEMKQTYRK
jgi:hypothetical protein